MIKYEVFPEEGLVSVLFDGEVSFQEVMDFHASLEKDKNYERTFDGIVDQRDATVSVTPDQLEEISEYNKLHKLVQGRWCHIVDTPIETALTNLYEEYAKTDHTVGYFNNIDSASQFMERDVSKFLFERPDKAALSA